MPIDYKNYPPDWAQIRDRIMKRAKNKCEWEGCRLEHGSTTWSFKFGGKTYWSRKLPKSMSRSEQLNIKTVKVCLTIAHLDHDETNHDVKDDRLMALCQLHHLQYDAKEKSRRRKAKKHENQLNIFNQ